MNVSRLRSVAAVAAARFRRKPDTQKLLKSDAQKLLLEHMPSSSVCAEIGVFKGDFSAKILETVRPRVLHLIDPWKYETSEDYKCSWFGGALGINQNHMDGLHQAVVDRFRQEIASGRVKIHRADSAGAAAQFVPCYFDWVYIDGNHLYEFAKRDLESYYPKIKPGGFITGDDYHAGGWWEGGVQRAVDEFVSQGKCKVISTARCQFILQKPGQV